MSKANEKKAREALKAAGVKPGAANAIIQQAAKTGSGISKNELAFIQQNAGQLAGQTKSQVDAKAFLGTVDTRRAAISGAAPTATPEQISPEEAARRAAQQIEDARLNRQRRDSIVMLQQMLEQYGLGSLASVVTRLKQENYSDEVVELKLMETPEWKARFIGNEERRKAGLPVLRPDEYLGVEAAYKKIMRDAQLPVGFYDDPSDFGRFIGFDISPTELQERVNMANLSLQNADPFYTDSLRTMYGLNDGDMLAYALDPERAMPLITRQVKAAQFGAEAARQGIQGISTDMAERYTGQFGVSQEQARQGFEQVAMIQPEAERLSAVFAGQEEGVGLEETTSAVFGGDQSADYKKRIQRLSEMEQSLFAGQSGVGRGSLGRSQTGQF
jgi:hypothetical protein